MPDDPVVPADRLNASAAEGEPARIPSPTRDPEFASPTATSLEAHDLLPTGIAPETYLRIVANPFLGFAGFVVWLLTLLWVIRKILESPDQYAPMTPLIAALFLACLWLIPALYQYHCLDCGHTGRLSDWRWHSCSTSALRRIAGRTRRVRGPTPASQIVIWLWLLLTFLFVMSRMGFDWRILNR